MTELKKRIITASIIVYDAKSYVWIVAIKKSP